MNSFKISLIALSFSLAGCCTTQTTPIEQKSITVPMFTTTEQGTGKSVGNITISQTQYGLLFTTDLHNLPLAAGVHGFHVHEQASCAHKGMAANGHLDPANSKHHLGPYNNQGHLGDLPALYINKDGSSQMSVLAPKLKTLSTVENRSLMIHEGGDNYSDQPAPMGGGKGRMVCGVIPA